MTDMCKMFLIVFLSAVFVVEFSANGNVVDLSCNFDKDLCNWYQDENNDLNWTFSSGGNDSSTAGLPKDQTTGCQHCGATYTALNACNLQCGNSLIADHYIFIESNGTEDMQTVELVSETQSPGNYCMTFWYTMNGNGARALRVFLLNNETLRQTELWNRTNDRTLSEVWLEVKLSIESHRYFKLRLSGTVSGSLRGNIAVNRVVFHNQWCSSECDFDNGWCVWTDENGSNNFRWDRSSDLHDYTKHGHFARASSSLYNTTSTFVLLNPRVYSGAYCLSFWYRIYHADGSFKIYLTYHGSGRIQPITEQQVNGFSEGWTLFQEDLITQEPFEIAIKVIFNQPSVMHIDDFNLSCGFCGCGYYTFEHGACRLKMGLPWRITGYAESENTSPVFDHTMQNGHYAYMDKNPTIAVMESPTVSSGVYCFSFWYYMNGQSSRQLKVLLNEEGLNQTSELFSKSENQGDKWRQTEIQINSTHNFSLVFVGSQENNSGGGIAVDDIHICLDQCETDTFPSTITTNDPTYSDLSTVPSTQSSQESGNGLLVAIAVATSCIAAIILAIFFFIIWRKTYGARMKQERNGNSDCNEESTAVENKTYAMTSIIHSEHRSAVNEHLQHTSTSSSYDVQNENSDYNYINLTTVPMKDKEAYVHPKVTHGSDKDNLDYSHLQCSKQKCSTENDKTHDQTNGINSTSMMNKDDDPTYDHTVMKITVKSCTENEYSHLERTTQEKDSYMQAVAGREALGEKTQSQKSAGEKDGTHFTLEKQDGQTEIETLHDESIEYFILEKTELQQK